MTDHTALDFGAHDTYRLNDGRWKCVHCDLEFTFAQESKGYRCVAYGRWDD